MNKAAPFDRDGLSAWLGRLIAIPSVTGNESAALDYAAGEFDPLAPEILNNPFPQDLSSHEEYLNDAYVASVPNRRNLVVRWPGTDSTNNKTRLVVQTHIDTVPYTGWDDGVRPKVEAGRLIGRGACDCKGQIAMLQQAARLLGGRDFRPRGSVEFQLVSEEEIGGNGALAAILTRPSAEGVIVLEPTQLRSHPANRGALWFQFEIEGRSVHMGRKWEGVNAVELACSVIQDLNEYEKRLLEESRNVPLFEEYATPVQVNVGMINGGQWPAMVAGECRIEGGVGFLPNKNREMIRRDLNNLIASSKDEWIQSHTRVTFDRLKNEAFVTPVDHPLVSGFSTALGANGLNAKPIGWNVSCDARLYATVGKMPVLVFGAGDIAQAHSTGEWIELEQIEKGAQVLADFIQDWCE